MQVILLERIEKLGQMGDVVNVKPGYARNYLLPKRKALRATRENVEGFESQRVQLEGANLERRQEAEAVAESLEGFGCVLLRQASDSAQLYGSVTARDIAEAVTEGGATIRRAQVRLDRPIKALGIHSVRIALHPEVFVSVDVNIARSADEAEAQAAAFARGETVGPDETAATEAGVFETAGAEETAVAIEGAADEAAATEAEVEAVADEGIPEPEEKSEADPAATEPDEKSKPDPASGD
jgi:large subunit ribosomal protein L9